MCDIPLTSQLPGWPLQDDVVIMLYNSFSSGLLNSFNLKCTQGTNHFCKSCKCPTKSSSLPAFLGSAGCDKNNQSGCFCFSDLTDFRNGMAPWATYHFRGKFLMTDIYALKDIFTETCCKAWAIKHGS